MTSPLADKFYRGGEETSLGQLKVRNLQVTNARGRVLLNAESINVDSGETIGIKGPSGAGKSTLLFALAGLQPHCTGSVIWDNQDLLSKTEAERTVFRRKHIGMVFQDFLLFDELGPAENAGIQALFQPKAARMHLKDNAQTLLQKLKVQRSSDEVSTYSGGERQRIAIARALAHEPSIILADEPTANLDRAATDALARDLVGRSREKGCTLIVVSHDPAVLDQTDRVLSITDGVVS